MEVGMAVKVITGACHAQKPVDGLQSLVRLAILVMNAERRGVCDQDVERTSVAEPVQQQPRQHPKCPQIGFRL